MNHVHTLFGIGAARPASTAPVTLLRRAALALRDAMREVAMQRRRRRLARATLLTLHSLDARTLRDIGLDRSEIPSVVSELGGEVDATRARILHSL